MIGWKWHTWKWVFKHPILTFKIFTCDHRDIDLKTLRCNRCEKQFRYVSPEEYFGKIKQNIETK